MLRRCAPTRGPHRTAYPASDSRPSFPPAGNQIRDIVPCPVNSCPISTFNSTLPAVPFSARITYNNDSAAGVGACECTPPQVC